MGLQIVRKPQYLIRLLVMAISMTMILDRVATAQFQPLSSPQINQPPLPSGKPPSLPSGQPPSIPSIGPKDAQKRPIRGQEESTQPLFPFEEEEELSSFEDYIRGETTEMVSTEIEQFGYDLFLRPPSTFAPVDSVPVSPDYLMGPGDEIRVNVWGKVNGDFFMTMDRDGKINVPQIGVIYLSGLTFSEAKTFIKNEFSRHFKPTEVQINIGLGSLRSVRVFVVGQARFPGSYTVSSFATLGNALFAAGGPTKSGTLRDIRVNRNGKTIISFDLYDLLLKGNKSKDIRILSEDVIFIPPVGSLAGIAGDVKNPAIYELNGETRLLDLIELAGGLTPLAYKGRVQIQRVENHESRSIFDSDLIDIENIPEKNILIQDGDLVKIFSVVQTTDWDQYRTVRIQGEVGRPGEYTVQKGTRLSSLIERAGGFTENAYLKGAIFSREVVRKLQQKQLDEAIDRLEQEILSQSARTIESALTPDAAQQEKAAMEQRLNLIVKMRTAEAKGRMTIRLVEIEKFRGSPSDIVLKQGDTLEIPEVPSHIQVIGSVYNETAFLFDPKAKTSSYLKKAGGIKKEAQEDDMYVLKIDGTAVSKRQAGGVFRDKFMASTLDPGDTIVVPEQIDRVAWLREFKDFTQILYQIAVTAGVIIVVF